MTNWVQIVTASAVFVLSSAALLEPAKAQKAGSNEQDGTFRKIHGYNGAFPGCSITENHDARLSYECKSTPMTVRIRAVDTEGGGIENWYNQMVTSSNSIRARSAARLGVSSSELQHNRENIVVCGQRGINYYTNSKDDSRSPSQIFSIVNCNNSFYEVMVHMYKYKPKAGDFAQVKRVQRAALKGFRQR